MKKHQFVLTDLEDRALAACDDMYLEATSAKEILGSWYGREIPFRDENVAERGIGHVMSHTFRYRCWGSVYW
jgi:hypothetical protein